MLTPPLNLVKKDKLPKIGLLGVLFGRARNYIALLGRLLHVGNRHFRLHIHIALRLSCVKGISPNAVKISK